MSGAATVPAIAWLRAGRPGAVAALVRVWGLGSLVAVLMTLSLALLGEGAAGDLDPTFGVGGKVTTDFGALAGASDLVLQTDGKLVAVGASGFIGDETETPDFSLARYLPNGSLDPTFGVGGKVITDLGGSEAASAGVLQPDGKLVAARGTGPPGSSGAFALVRYRPDGSLDPTFGVGGIVTTNFADSASATSVVLQPDGKLVAAGLSFIVEGSSLIEIDFALARYRPDGSLDPGFGVGGKVTTDFAGGGRTGALVLQTDGKLVAAGGAGGDFALARYLSPPLVNDFVSFKPIPSTFGFTANPAGCPEGFVGTFSFEARLTNTSDGSLTDLVVEVTTLTHGNLLQNADGGPGGVGAQLTVPQEDGFADGVLSADEVVDVPFVICVTARAPFTFVVDVFGDVE